ncbi:hypothetical protein D3C81_748950 [compost metagenome]
MLEQFVGQGAEVDVGAVHAAGRGDFLVGRAARHHQRHPLGHGGLVFGVFHVREGMVLLEQLKALLQEVDALVALDVAQVRHRGNEGLGRAERAFLGQVGPELLGHLELGIDVHGFLDIDATVGSLWRVVQLTQPGVAGTGVVPRVGTFRGTGVHQLDYFQLDRGVEFLEQYCQGGTHDAGPYQYHVDCFVLRHLTPPKSSAPIDSIGTGLCRGRHVRFFAIPATSADAAFGAINDQ